MVQGGLEDMLNKVKGATSTRLQILLARASATVRTGMVVAMHACQTAWVEEIDSKFRLHQRLPHSLAGSFDGAGSKSADEARSWGLNCMQAFDDEPDTSKHHRVALRLLALGSTFRTQLQRFVDGETQCALPELLVELRCFALCPLVERKIEQPHSAIHRTFRL